MSYASVPPPHSPAQLAAGMAAARDFERRHPSMIEPVSEADRINALADDYKRGLDKMVASGYEEFGIDTLRNHATVIKALRAYAKYHPANPETWTITSRRKMTERIFWAWSLLFCWPNRP